MLICEYCGKEHNGEYGSGRFCCKSCASKFSRTFNKDITNNIYKCKYCGLEFQGPYKLAGHTTHCKQNPNYEKNLKNCNNLNNEKNKDIFRNNPNNILKIQYCLYCGKECHNKNSLINHERLCSLNPNRTISGLMKYNQETHEGIRLGTNLYIKAKLLGLPKPEISKQGLYNISSIWRGKKLPLDVKQKISNSTIEYIESTKGKCKPRYSIKGCRYIDTLNETYNWHLQHAENGGEKQIGCYFLDGYDSSLNIAFEYDERYHYKDIKNNILRDKDKEKLDYIIQLLDCEFWRYNEKLDLLYKVN